MAIPSSGSGATGTLRGITVAHAHVEDGAVVGLDHALMDALAAERGDARSDDGYHTREPLQPEPHGPPWKPQKLVISDP